MPPPTTTADVYLASASPRRRELLTQIGVRWALRSADVDETRHCGEDPSAYVSRLALEKARAARRNPDAGADCPVIAADTAVVAGGEVLGKPLDAADAARMLGLLSGRTHEVFTAVAVISARGESVALSRSAVTLRALSAAEIDAYWRTGEPADKAGAYAIQGRGAIFVAEIRGSFSGVAGLPLFEAARLLGEHGVEVLAAGAPPT